MDIKKLCVLNVGKQAGPIVTGPHTTSPKIIKHLKSDSSLLS